MRKARIMLMALMLLTSFQGHGETGYKQLYIEVMANISSYTAAADECGKDDGITASMVPATVGRTLAIDGLPFGTAVEIEGEDVDYVIEDRFGGDYHLTEPLVRIDRFVATKEEAWAYGRQYKMVRIYLPLQEELEKNSKNL